MKNVRIIEVGPRDGLQNEPVAVPTDVKLDFVRKLAEAGLDEIEATSFVSPKWVPQLSDADQLWPQLPIGPKYSALVPNLKGLERAMRCGVGRIAVFTAASDDFCRHNLNMSLADSLSVFAEVISSFRSQTRGGWVRGYVSTVFECPYAGKILPAQVADVVQALFEMGVDEVSLGDTIGVAAPPEVRALTRTLASNVALENLAYHFHDTHGTAIANVFAALEDGVHSFDSSAGGLGGCPYAPGAAGNLATESLIYLLERIGVETGIDSRKVALAASEMKALVHPVTLASPSV